MILIRQAELIDPVERTRRMGDLLIQGGIILEAGKDLSKLADEQSHKLQEKLTVIDGAGCIAAPGLMDAHVHFRDPGFLWKEDMITGARAAKHGGFTTVVCMANTDPAVDSKETLEYCLQKGAQTGIHLLQTACITKGLKGKELTDMETLAARGAAGFTDDGIPLMDEAILLEAMQRAKALNLPVSLHEEDPLFIRQPGVNRGAVSEQIGYGGADRMAEDVMVARDCMLALHTGAKVCMQHISSARSVELIRQAKKMGADVYAEATPHHFSLTEEAVLKYGTNARMNPPLRTEEDRLAIIEGLRDGTIDMIVTDHAPHAAFEKEKPMDKAPSGIIGLETSLGLAIRSLVQPGYLTMVEVLGKMSVSPALLYGLKPGRLQPGEPADLVLFGENEIWTVERFHGKSSNSPFLGWQLPGKIHATICGGNLVYCDLPGLCTAD